MPSDLTPERIAGLRAGTACRNCLRTKATDDDWKNTRPGERDDLCWEDEDQCRWYTKSCLENMLLVALDERDREIERLRDILDDAGYAARTSD